MTGAADIAVPSGRETWYLPTLRNSAISLLAGGLVTPAAGLSKDQADLLRHAPSRLLLSRTGAATDWFSVDLADPEDLPVLLELAVSFSHENDAMPDTDGGVIAPSGVIPASAVQTIHLRNEQDVDAARSRRYDNFDPEEFRFAASPGLFEGRSETAASVAAWLDSLEAGSLTAERLRQADAIGGATMMVCAVPAMPSEDLTVRASIMTGMFSGSPTSDPVTLCLGALGSEAWLSNDVEADRRLLACTLTVLAGVTPGARLGARRLLGQIKSQAVLDLEAEQRSVIEGNLDRAESILRSQAELKPFSRNSGLRSAKSLLLFLLRPEPSETVTWAQDMVSDPLAVLGASVLSGLVAGRRLLPTALRLPEIRVLADAVEADRLNDSASGLGRFAAPEDLSIRVVQPVTGQGHPLVITIGGSEVIRAAAAPAIEPTRETLFEPTEPGVEAGEGAPREPSLDDLLAGADIANPDVTRACAAVCKRFGWDDLVVTVVVGDKQGFSVVGNEVTFPGVPRITRRIQLDVMRERLREHPNPGGAELKALNTLLGVPEKPKMRKPRKKTGTT